MIWENTLSGMVDSTASRFDESTQYKKSDYVWYAATGVKPKLYKALEDVSAGTWNASKWKEVTSTKEFVNKDLVHPLYKNVLEGFESNSNRFGYRKYEPWYEFRPESDHTAMYNKDEPVYFEYDGEWFIDVHVEDHPCTFQEVVENYGFEPLYWNDDGELVTDERTTPIEGEFYSYVDEDWNKCFYKYSDN